MVTLINKKFSLFKLKQTEVAVIYHRLESSEVASKLTRQQKTLQCRQFDSLWISRAKTSSAVLIEPKFLREREGAAIHPILNSSSYVRHQTKHKRRLWCYLWIRNFHSLKVKQTGGEEAFWPPTHWWSVIKRFIYHSVPEGAKFVDFSHFTETPTMMRLCLLWISDTGISLTKSTPDMTTVKSIHQIFYPRRNSGSLKRINSLPLSIRTNWPTHTLFHHFYFIIGTWSDWPLKSKQSKLFMFPPNFLHREV